MPQAKEPEKLRRLSTKINSNHTTQFQIMFYPTMIAGGITSGYASMEASEAKSAAREAQTSAELLTHDIDRLLLITEALWTLMKQQHGYADDVLLRLIEEIEQKKTAVNGISVKNPPQLCPSCHRPNSAGRLFCIYCGQPVPGNPFAR
jgi:hypothetical protein